MDGAISIKVDFEKRNGKFKPMHGIGQPPRTGLRNSMFHYLGEAGIPFSRLHDVSGYLGGGLFVDIPNIFRDFDADENDPDSYDFTFTDKIIEGLVEAGCQPYYRLGVTIENQHMLKSYRIFPPKDYDKWARICEHVIRHYNEGWAEGYHFGITYWEIWNEPDDCYTEKTAAMWKGTPEQYFRLYSVVSRHLKACFGDSIKVGGYGHCGLYEYAQDKDLCGLDHEATYIHEFTISFLHDFLKYQSETGAPIDFFSWHVYDFNKSTRKEFLVVREHADYVRRILDRYGYSNAEHHLNEWNMHTDVRHRDVPLAAAKSLGFMLMMQNTSTDLMCYYDGGLGYSPYRALINPDSGYPYRTYYAFMMYNTLYRLENSVCAESSDDHVFAAAAVNGKRAAIVVSNVNDTEVSIDLDVSGFRATEVQFCRIDEGNRYTVTGEALTEKLSVPAHGCVEIKLWNLD